MDRKSLKDTLTTVEVLGLDSQPIRDFIVHYQKGTVLPDEFEHILSMMDLLIETKKYAPHSSPPQISLLLKQLQDQMEASFSKEEVSDTGVSASVNIDLLNMLIDIKKDLRELKDTPIKEVTVIKEQIRAEESSRPELNPVFVPLESAFTKELKGSVILEEKTGDNIASKLSRLKGMKKNGQ